jgi:hypothetical protein
MLVLALQFSRSNAQHHLIRCGFSRSDDLPAPPPGATLPAAERNPKVSHAHAVRRGNYSLKTEEKTKPATSSRQEGTPYNCSTRCDRPDSAPTGNWFEPGWANANQRLNSAP